MEVFQQTNSLKKKLTIMLYIPYLYNPMRKRLLNQCGSQSKKLTAVSTTTPVDRVSSRVGLKEDASRSEDFIGEELIEHWMPELHWFGNCYYVVSNTLHTINFINCFLLLLLPSLSSRSGLSASSVKRTVHESITAFVCQMPRFVLHEYYESSTLLWLSAFFSGLHLSWRLIIIVTKRGFLFNPILFLMIDEQHLRMIVDKFTRPDSPFDDCPTRKRNLEHPIIAMLFYTLYNKSNRQEKLYLRPNRTLEARVKLKQTLERAFVMSSTLFILIYALFLAVSINTILFKINLFYRDCPPTDSQLVYVQRVTLSVFLLIVHLIDGLAAILMVPLLALALVTDLNYYFSYVKSELTSILLTLPKTETPPLTTTTAPVFKKTFTQNYLKYSSYLTNTSARESDYLHDTKICPQYFTFSGEHEFDFDTIGRNHRIQMIVCDFFAQLHHGNTFMSILVNFAYVIWLAFNSIITFTGLQSDTTIKIYLIRGVQVLALCILIALSSLILTLKRSTESAYTTLNSIMANDTSLDKRRWCILLKYYTGKPRHAFTFLLSELFTLGILLKLLSYTITFTFFIQSIR